MSSLTGARNPPLPAEFEPSYVAAMQTMHRLVFDLSAESWGTTLASFIVEWQLAVKGLFVRHRTCGFYRPSGKRAAAHSPGAMAGGPAFSVRSAMRSSNVPFLASRPRHIAS